ncbi:MAG: ATP-grasp domain-containing protein, partial [Geminicoccales bacterium]
MDLEEAEAKDVLRQAGIRVPPGEVCRDADAVAAAAARLGRSAVKAQVPAGKRGRAGGIRLVDGPDEAHAAAAAILGMEIAGHRVERVLVEKCADIAQELYLAVLNDVATRGPMLLFSPSGGMDIEEMAGSVVRIPVDLDKGLKDVRLPLDQDVADLAALLYDLYLQTDAELLEVNPLVRLKGGGLLALDCKLTVDDAALYRQPELAQKGARENLTELERRARELGLKYIELPGNVGVLANGAGLTMTTMDVIEH